MKVLEVMETLQKENADLQQKVTESNDTIIPTHIEQEEGEVQCDLEAKKEQIEKKKMYDELKELVRKYKEMTKRIGGPSWMECLLNQTDMLYSERVMAIPISPKFKVPQVDIYDRFKDFVDHLENFKAHITFHGFLSEIMC